MRAIHSLELAALTSPSRSRLTGQRTRHILRAVSQSQPVSSFSYLVSPRSSSILPFYLGPRPHLRTMADDKSGKQATLGYVRDGQMTLGCVDVAPRREAPNSLDLSLSNLMPLLTRFLPYPDGSLDPTPTRTKPRRSRPHCHLVGNGKDRVAMQTTRRSTTRQRMGLTPSPLTERLTERSKQRV